MLSTLNNKTIMININIISQIYFHAPMQSTVDVRVCCSKKLSQQKGLEFSRCRSSVRPTKFKETYDA